MRVRDCRFQDGIRFAHRVSIEENPAKFHIVSRLDNEIDVRRGQVMRPAGGYHPLDNIHRLGRGEIIERNAKNGDRRSAGKREVILDLVHRQVVFRPNDSNIGEKSVIRGTLKTV